MVEIGNWSPKYAIYNEISSVDYLCELCGPAAGQKIHIFTREEFLFLDECIMPVLT